MWMWYELWSWLCTHEWFNTHDLVSCLILRTQLGVLTNGHWERERASDRCWKKKLWPIHDIVCTVRFCELWTNSDKWKNDEIYVGLCYAIANRLYCHEYAVCMYVRICMFVTKVCKFSTVNSSRPACLVHSHVLHTNYIECRRSEWYRFNHRIENFLLRFACAMDDDSVSAYSVIWIPNEHRQYFLDEYSLLFEFCSVC